MRISMESKGKTPLLMHNERLSDPDDEYARQIKEITSKGTNQTDKDKELISQLEWRGGIYVDATDIIVVPTPNIIRCLREAATVTKAGKKIARGLSPISLTTPLLINDGGPKRAKELMSKQEYYDRRQVKVRTGRIKRTRPIFASWGLVMEFELLDDVLNFAEFVGIVELAGRATGLGDGRIIGYGRFEAVIRKVK